MRWSTTINANPNVLFHVATARRIAANIAKLPELLGAQTDSGTAQKVELTNLAGRGHLGALFLFTRKAFVATALAPPWT